MWVTCSGLYGQWWSLDLGPVAGLQSLRSEHPSQRPWLYDFQHEGSDISTRTLMTSKIHSSWLIWLCVFKTEDRIVLCLQGVLSHRAHSSELSMLSVTKADHVSVSGESFHLYVINTLTVVTRQCGGRADGHLQTDAQFNSEAMCKQWHNRPSCKAGRRTHNTLTGRDTGSVRTATRSTQNTGQAGQALSMKGVAFLRKSFGFLWV